MDVIAFVEEEFCEVGAVLAGHARDEGNVLFAHKIRFWDSGWQASCRFT